MALTRFSRLLRMLLPLLLAVLLVSCSGSAAGLQRFSSADGRYAFLYPTGWNRVAIRDGLRWSFTI